jgi:hypothetical protein
MNSKAPHPEIRRNKVFHLLMMIALSTDRISMMNNTVQQFKKNMRVLKIDSLQYS